MHYILDNEGYVEEVSFGGIIECKNNTCSEYTGKVPTGYSSLEDWHLEANIRAYKVVDGNLVFDPNRDYKLRILFDQEAEDNRHITKKELGIKNTEEVNPYADLFPNLSSFGGYITWVEEEFGKVGNFPTEEVKLSLSEEQDLDLIELEFIGDNFLPNTATSTSNNGITYTPNIDKTIDISGIATDKSTLNLAGTDTSVRHILTFKEGYDAYNSDGVAVTKPYHYALWGLEEGISLEFYNYDGTDRTLIGTYKNNDVITFDKDTNVTQVILTVDKGTSINTTIKPMLKLVNLEYPVMSMTKYKGNLFDKNNIIDGWIRASDNKFWNEAGTFSCTDYIKVKPNTTYILDLHDATSLGSGGIMEYDDEKTWLNIGLPETKQIMTFTTSENTHYIRFTVRNASVDYIQLEEGSTLSEYKEYNGRDGQYYIDGVSTQEVRSGKNLLNKNNAVKSNSDVAYEVLDTGIRVYNSTAGTHRNIYIDTEKLSAGTYTLNQNISVASGTAYVLIQKVNDNGETTQIKTTGSSGAVTFTLDTDAKIRVVLYSSRGTSEAGDVSYTNLQLEKGTATNYESYGVAPSPDYPSEIVNIYKAGTYNAIANNRVYEITIDEDLRCLPNGTSDRLWLSPLGSFDIERKVGKAVLNGSESWTYNSTYSRYEARLTSCVGANAYNVISNYFRYNGVNTNGIWVNNAGTNLQIRIKNDMFTTTEELITWLTTHNTELHYSLIEQSTTNSGTSYNEYEYEEYKNNTTLIDLAGNEFTTDDLIVIRDNQVMLVKNGAIDNSYDEEGNEKPVDYDYKFLGYVSMPRTYTPHTNVYCHQRVYVDGFKYRDCRNIDMTKIKLEGSLTINEIETNNLLVNGVSVEENITTAHEIATNTFLNGYRVYKKQFTGKMPTTSKTTTALFLYDMEAAQVWVDESMSFLTSDATTMPTNFYTSTNDYLRMHVRKNEKSIVYNSGGDLSAWNYSIVLAYTKGWFEEPEEPEKPIENPIVEVNKTTTLTGSTNSNVWTFKTVATETKIDKINATSTVKVTNYIGRPSSIGSSYFMGTYTTSYNCGGKSHSETIYKNSGTISSGGWCELGSHTFTIAHTTEPMKITVSGSMNTSAFNPSSASASGTVTLTEI